MAPKRRTGRAATKNLAKLRKLAQSYIVQSNLGEDAYISIDGETATVYHGDGTETILSLTKKLESNSLSSSSTIPNVSSASSISSSSSFGSAGLDASSSANQLTAEYNYDSDINMDSCDVHSGYREDMDLDCAELDPPLNLTEKEVAAESYLYQLRNLSAIGRVPVPGDSGDSARFCLLHEDFVQIAQAGHLNKLQRGDKPFVFLTLVLLKSKQNMEIPKVICHHCDHSNIESEMLINPIWRFHVSRLDTANLLAKMDSTCVHAQIIRMKARTSRQPVSDIELCDFIRSSVVIKLESDLEEKRTHLDMSSITFHPPAVRDDSTQNEISAVDPAADSDGASGDDDEEDQNGNERPRYLLPFDRLDSKVAFYAVPGGKWTGDWAVVQVFKHGKRKPKCLVHHRSNCGHVQIGGWETATSEVYISTYVLLGCHADNLIF